MFKLNKYYKHINNTDVVFKPTSIAYTDNIAILDGFWINVSSKNYFVIDGDRIRIKEKDFDKWKEFEYSLPDL